MPILLSAAYQSFTFAVKDFIAFLGKAQLLLEAD